MRFFKILKFWKISMQENESCIQTFSVTIHERKNPTGRSRHRWEDDTEMNSSEIMFYIVYRIQLAEDRAQ
jgi:hypothetical protein